MRQLKAVVIGGRVHDNRLKKSKTNDTPSPRRNSKGLRNVWLSIRLYEWHDKKKEKRQQQKDKFWVLQVTETEDQSCIRMHSIIWRYIPQQWTSTGSGFVRRTPWGSSEIASRRDCHDGRYLRNVPPALSIKVWMGWRHSKALIKTLAGMVDKL